MLPADSQYADLFPQNSEGGFPPPEDLPPAYVTPLTQEVNRLITMIGPVQNKQMSESNAKRSIENQVVAIRTEILREGVNGNHKDLNRILEDVTQKFEPVPDSKSMVANLFKVVAITLVFFTAAPMVASFVAAIVEGSSGAMFLGAVALTGFIIWKSEHKSTPAPKQKDENITYDSLVERLRLAMSQEPNPYPPAYQS